MLPRSTADSSRVMGEAVTNPLGLCRCTDSLFTIKKYYHAGVKPWRNWFLTARLILDGSIKLIPALVFAQIRYALPALLEGTDLGLERVLPEIFEF